MTLLTRSLGVGYNLIASTTMARQTVPNMRRTLMGLRPELDIVFDDADEYDFKHERAAFSIIKDEEQRFLKQIRIGIQSY
jgi:hypothetical protein